MRWSLVRSDWGRSNHFLAALGVAIGSWLSAYFILVTNAFMQHPVGYAMTADDRLEIADLRAYLLNPWAMVQFAHNQAAALVTGSVRRDRDGCILHPARPLP